MTKNIFFKLNFFDDIYNLVEATLPNGTLIMFSDIRYYFIHNYKITINGAVYSISMGRGYNVVSGDDENLMLFLLEFGEYIDFVKDCP